jgi:glutathione S-transferase
MPVAPDLTLHVLPFSHPCLTARSALELKGLEFEEVVLTPGAHNEEIERLYGPGRRTVPGLLVDGEAVHGSRAIVARLDALVEAPPLFPEDRADAVREAERWGDEVLQDLPRRLSFGALHFRPEAIGTFTGGAPLDPKGTDFAMGYLRGTWKYHGITAVRLAEDLAALPAALDRVDGWIAEGVLGDEAPNAADLQIGASLRVLLTIGDLEPLFDERPAAGLARRLFPEYPGYVPAGAFPAGWVPGRG